MRLHGRRVFMKRYSFAVLFAAVLCANSFAQQPARADRVIEHEAESAAVQNQNQHDVEVKAELVLTPQEKFELRTAQADFFKAKVDHELAQTRLDNTFNALNAKSGQVCTKHKLPPDSCQICDGPNQGLCAAVPIGDIQLVLAPKPASKPEHIGGDETPHSPRH